MVVVVFEINVRSSRKKHNWNVSDSANAKFIIREQGVDNKFLVAVGNLPPFVKWGFFFSNEGVGEGGGREKGEDIFLHYFGGGTDIFMIQK